MYSVDGALLSRQYKLHISNFSEWEEQVYSHDFIIFEDNIGEYLSIDETTLSQGEIYTIVTNKSAKGRKGSLVAIIKGTKSDNVTYALSKIPTVKRKKVKEVTLDLAPTMKQIVKFSFPYAVHVSDRFHVQRLINEAVNDLRVSYR
jgi:transposase